MFNVRLNAVTNRFCFVSADQSATRLCRSRSCFICADSLASAESGFSRFLPTYCRQNVLQICSVSSISLSFFFVCRCVTFFSTICQQYSLCLVLYQFYFILLTILVLVCSRYFKIYFSTGLAIWVARPWDSAMNLVAMNKKFHGQMSMRWSL